MFRQCSFQVIRSHLTCVPWIVYPASGVDKGVDKSAIVVEDEKVKRSQGTLRPGNVLRLIAEIDPEEIVLFHPRNHMVEIIVWVYLLAVGVDSDQSYAFGCEFVRRLPSDFIGACDVGTAIARE